MSGELDLDVISSLWNNGIIRSRGLGLTLFFKGGTLRSHKLLNWAVQQVSKIEDFSDKRLIFVLRCLG